MFFKKPPKDEPSQDERLQKFLEKEGVLPADEQNNPDAEQKSLGADENFVDAQEKSLDRDENFGDLHEKRLNLHENFGDRDEIFVDADEKSLDAEQNFVAPDENLLAPPSEPISPGRALLRPLAEGASLGGERDIRRGLERGPINQYLADIGDYSDTALKLVFERAAPQNSPENAPQNALFVAAKRFFSDEREYAVYDFQKLTPLRDFGAPANDERYLGALQTLADSLQLARENGARPADLGDSLFVDANGELRFFGFFDALGDAPDEKSDLQILAALSSRLARDTFAAHATLRLDDEFGALPLCDETKNFARALSGGGFPDLASLRAALNEFSPFVAGEISLQLDVGLERELNEDSGFAWRLQRAGEFGHLALDVLAVADGMGGHEGGEIASALALETLQNSVLRRLKLNWNDNAQILAAMREIGEECNAAVVRMNENPPYSAMRHKPGSTLVWAIRAGSRVFLGNIGDSRAYRWNAARGLERLTKDHSYVQDLLDAGRISQDEAWGHPDGNVILSHVGMARGLMLDVSVRVLRAGDRLVLVSDGVVDTMRDPQIEEIIAGGENAPGLAAKLVEKANENGGVDNISVACLFSGSGEMEVRSGK